MISNTNETTNQSQLLAIEDVEQSPSSMKNILPGANSASYKGLPVDIIHDVKNQLTPALPDDYFQCVKQQLHTSDKGFYIALLPGIKASYTDKAKTLLLHNGFDNDTIDQSIDSEKNIILNQKLLEILAKYVENSEENKIDDLFELDLDPRESYPETRIILDYLEIPLIDPKYISTEVMYGNTGDRENCGGHFLEFEVYIDQDQYIKDTINNYINKLLTVMNIAIVSNDEVVRKTAHDIFQPTTVVEDKVKLSAADLINRTFYSPLLQ